MEYRVGCKINLNLHIVGRRENGYHELDSLFLPVPSVFDTIYIEEKGHGIEIFCDTLGIDLKDNTLVKAYNLFAKETGFAHGIKVELKKGIPHGAGLGGGSADGAFILKYLYMKWKNFSSIEKIEQNKDAIEFLLPLAVQIGADVPFFLHNKPMRAQGIGEILSEFDSNFLNKTFLLLVCPKIHVNTAQVFKNFKKENPYIAEKVKKNVIQDLTTIMSQDINSLYPIEKGFFVNDLEPSAFSLFPKLGDYKRRLLECEARIALMSGSGSSIFALFDTEKQAQEAKVALQSKANEAQEEMQLLSIIEL